MSGIAVTLSDVNSRAHPCRRCRSVFRVALPSERRDRKDLALLARGKSPKLIEILREITRCDLTDAKGTLEHVTQRPGKCHQCAAELPIDYLVDCRSCDTLNIQLEAAGPGIPCPACGFIVFIGSYGSYEVCPLCDWEDDGVQLANPTSSGGANREALCEVQIRALSVFPLGAELPGFNRSAAWRPLNHSEVGAFRAAQAISHWHSEAVVDEAEAYWCRAASG